MEQMQTVLPSEEELEEGRRLFAGPCDFFFGAQTIEQLPPPDRAEVAFAGRSNVVSPASLMR